jgi:hypothetical protein
MKVRLLAIMCLAFLLAGTCSEKPLGAGHYRWEGIRGFAIWPEDQPEQGLAACEERLDEEPWRADPGLPRRRSFVRSSTGENRLTLVITRSARTHRVLRSR